MLRNSAKKQTSMLLKRSKAALALGIIFCGVSLFSGEASATTKTTVSCSFNGGTSGSPPPSPVPSCSNILSSDPAIPSLWQSFAPNKFQLGDKLFTFVGVNSQSNAAGHIEFAWLDLDSGLTTYADDVWSVITTFDEALENEKGYIDYNLEVVNPGLSSGWRFSGVKLDSTVPTSGDPSVKVEKFINNFSEGSAYLTSINGEQDPYPSGFKPLTGTFIAVRDQWTIPDGQALSDIVNTYTQSRDAAPGPLPLLGAGAAFGFSRRLRKRIQGQHAA